MARWLIMVCLVAGGCAKKTDFKAACLAIQRGDALTAVAARLEAAGGVPRKDNPLRGPRGDWYWWTIARNAAGGLPYCSVGVGPDKRVISRVYDVSYGGN
jgi:hypothetical protein